MSRKNRTTKDNVGIVYLFTNELYERENMYKYGITINPFQRKRVQSNSTPPPYHFYDRIVLFSKYYKDIEKRLTKKFSENNYLLREEDDSLFSGMKGGQEWIQADLPHIVDIFKEILMEFPDAEMCYQSKRFKRDKDKIAEYKVPNCRLDFLGILDGDTIKCIDGQSFQVQDNGIIVNGEVMTLSKYMKSSHKREGNTNEWNGFMYFTYKGYNIYKMWQSLVKPKDE